MPQMTLRLTDEARAGWERGCTLYGVSLTALAEALGLRLLEDADLFEDREITPETIGERGYGVVELARQIDAERRSRKLGP